MIDKKSPSTDARRVAMDLLARREHTAVELTRKLKTRGFDADSIDQAIAGLQADHLQSDTRFAEQFAASRIRRGQGPLRIRAELKRRGLPGSSIEDALRMCDPDWPALARTVREKRFGEAAPKDYRERARQARFLQQRGFDGEQISQAVGSF